MYYLRRRHWIFFPQYILNAMKQVLFSLRNKAEVILSNSVATKNRPLKFKIVVVTICVADFIVMVYCMLNLAK